MNVQKIYHSLSADDDNSVLGIICGELENQGYSVIIDGMQVTFEYFFNGKYTAIEEKIGPYHIALNKKRRSRTGIFH
ncbi:MAG: hypothetical protein CVU71_07300 [Deltaproteobacteria bacterium HGW-Deltaproteobacteria-6]|jgi:hypothetical protein|nr:MAG: hypothetical protein CVU71_07300 [Deltaproteobacteria bacterium HGW-Deltaproteobacteria-6]